MSAGASPWGTIRVTRPVESGGQVDRFIVPREQADAHMSEMRLAGYEQVEEEERPDGVLFGWRLRAPHPETIPAIPAPSDGGKSPVAEDVLPAGFHRLYTQTGIKLAIPRHALKGGRGKRGRVFPVHGAHDLVVKAYHLKLPPAERKRVIAKLEQMIAVEQLPGLRKPDPPLFAWPLAILYRDEARKEPIGFAMKRLSEWEEGTGGWRALSDFLSPPFSYMEGARGLFGIATEIARVFVEAHRRGYLVCDVSDKNIRVYAPSPPSDARLRAALIDCDSIQFASGGTTYLGEERNALFVSPEVLAGEPCTQAADTFALAILMYWILTAQQHPFDGVEGQDAAGGSGQAGDPTRDLAFTTSDRIAAGMSFLSSTADMLPPARSRLSVVPEEAAWLAERCFSRGHDNPSARPTAEEWLKALESIVLYDCTENARHVKYDENARCPV